MNGVSLRIGVFATMAALGALLLTAAGPASAAKPFGKDGTIYACFKVKGKNKGALRVVSRKPACKRMRGWQPLSWSAVDSGGASGQVGSQGVSGQQGPQGSPGAEGKQGEQGLAGQVEKTLIETVQSQATQINALSAEVTDLTDKVQGLEGTVGDTCDQLEVLTDQSNEILDSLLGSSVAILGNLLNVPSPPDPLGTFECT